MESMKKPYLVQTELQTTRWTAWWSDGKHGETSPGYSSSSAQRRPEKWQVQFTDLKKQHKILAGLKTNIIMKWYEN